MARSASTFFWNGSVDGSYTNPSNWSNPSGGVWVGAYPGYDVTNSANVSGDAVYYSTTCTYAPSGYDASTVGQLADLTVTNQFAVTSGSANLFADSPLNVSAENVILDCSKAGNININGASISALYLQGTATGNIAALGGTINSITLYKGTASISATTTTLNVLFKSIQASDVSCSITSGAVITNAQCAGGVISCSSAIPNLTMSPGTGTWTQVSGDITNLVSYGGMVIANGGDITNLTISGTVDLSKSENPRSIGSATLYPGGSLNINNGASNITVTNPVVDYGGSLQVSPGAKISISY